MINRFLPPNPAEVIAKRQLALNPNFNSKSRYLEGKLVPTTAVSEMNIAKDIGREFTSQADAIKSAARAARRSSVFDLALTGIGLIPGLGTPALIAKGAMMLGGGVDQPDLKEGNESIELSSKLLAASQADVSSFMENMKRQAVEKGQENLSDAKIYAAKQAKSTELINLANMFIGIGKGVSSLLESSTTPIPKTGMEHAAAEQTAAGLTPGKDLMTTPAKEFASATGLKSVFPQLETIGLEDLPDSNPGQWGWTGLVPEGTELDAIVPDPLYPHRTWEYIEGVGDTARPLGFEGPLMQSGAFGADQWKGTTTPETFTVPSIYNPPTPYNPPSGMSLLQKLGAYRAVRGDYGY